MLQGKNSRQLFQLNEMRKLPTTLLQTRQILALEARHPAPVVGRILAARYRR
jgi:hypothetical protein